MESRGGIVKVPLRSARNAKISKLTCSPKKKSTQKEKKIEKSEKGVDEGMKKSNYTEEQIAFTLKRVELGTPISEVCRKLGIAEQRFYRWKSKYGGMLPSDMKWFRQLEEQNAKLKKLVTKLSLDKLMLQDALTKKFYGLLKSGKPCGIYRNVFKRANAEAVRYCGSTGNGTGGSRPGRGRPFYE
jgi:putative transposase